MQLWSGCGGHSTQGGRRYSPKEQQKKEKAYDEALRTVERDLKRPSRTKSGRLETQKRVTASFARFSATALDLDPEMVDLLTNDFLPVGTKLARWARRFDPSLSMADITQACRNAWTACGLQPLLGESIRITPSILGYSLLYPYSDNFLDCEDVSGEAKLRFSERFRDRLRGQRLSADDHRESALWALVHLVEGHYPRARCPQVWDCLLAIHRAQEESIAQLSDSGRCNDADLLRKSCAKGGSAVRRRYTGPLRRYAARIGNTLLARGRSGHTPRRSRDSALELQRVCREPDGRLAKRRDEVQGTHENELAVSNCRCGRGLA
jgi:hypothetical protein